MTTRSAGCRRRASLAVRLEMVPDTWLRHQIAWAGRVGFQFVPKLPHIHPQAMTGLGMARPPDILQQLAMGDHSASIPHESGQEFLLNGGEMHLLLGDVHLPSSQVDAQITHRKRRLTRLLGLSLGDAAAHLRSCRHADVVQH